MQSVDLTVAKKPGLLSCAMVVAALCAPAACGAREGTLADQAVDASSGGMSGDSGAEAGAATGGVAGDGGSAAGQGGAPGNGGSAGAGGSAGSGNATTLASGQLCPGVIALDADYVYWGNYYYLGASVLRVPKAGGATVELAKNEVYVSGIAVNSTTVYWSGQDNGAGYSHIGRVPKEGGTASFFDTKASAALALDATHVYWVDSVAMGGGPYVWMAGLDGANPTALVPGAAQHGKAIAVDGNWLFWATDGYEKLTGAISSRQVSAGTGTLASNLDQPNAIAVDATDVFWAEWSAIRAISRQGGAIRDIATNLDYPGAIAADGSWVYFASSSQVAKVPKAGGGQASPFATNMAGRSGIAVDDTSVYWPECPDIDKPVGLILKAPK
jgi:hypothetical protein